MTERMSVTVGRLTVWRSTGEGEAPSIGSLTVGRSVPALPMLGRLTVYRTVGDGEGPSIGSLTVGRSLGDGEGPSVGAVAVWRYAPETVGVGRLTVYRSLAIEPMEGEKVLWTETLTPEWSPVNSVRVAVSPEEAERIRICLVRAETGQALDAWDTYEAFAPNVRHALKQMGQAYRIALIGAGQPPDPLVVWNPD